MPRPLLRKPSALTTLVLALVLALAVAAAALRLERASHAGPAPANTSSVGSLAAATPTTRCTSPGGNCLTTHCCKDLGHLCYAKDDKYGTCDPWCAGAEHKDWSCKKHGARTCSWPGESCRTDPVGHNVQNPCCSVPGQACFEKDKNWASCKSYCNPNEYDSSGQKWSCKKLGGGRPMGGIWVDKAPKGKEAETSLFCVTTLTPKDKDMSAIMRVQDENKLGIFACDDHAIWGWTANSKHGMSKKYWQTIAETDFFLFLDVWKHVKDDTRYKAHDFTVKVDPGTVFLPSRLRQHLKELRTQAGDSVYIKTRQPGGKKPSFSAAIMVFSKMSLVDFYWSELYCTQHADHKYGQAAWWENCMDAIGITHMVDEGLLKDDMHGPADCKNASTVAFSPIQGARDWEKCQKAASGAREKDEGDDFADMFAK